MVLLIREVPDGPARATAACAAALALGLIPFTPPGIPVIASCLAVVAGRAMGAR